MTECNPEDCLSVPFPRKCSEYCIERILIIAKPDEKINILGMNKRLADAIFRAYNSGFPVTTFNDLQNKLTSEQVNSIKMVFDNLKQSQLDHFIRRLPRRTDSNGRNI